MVRILTSLLLIASITIQAQDFEGEIKYVVDFELSQKMIDMDLTKDIMKSKLEAEGNWSDTIILFYSKGNYKQLYLSNNKSWGIYRSDSNKIFAFQEGDASAICTVTDVSIDLESSMTGASPKVTLLDSIVEFKDLELKIVEVKWKAGTYFYLFNENLFTVNPELYKGHVYDGIYDYLKISKSFPVQIIKKTGGAMVVTISMVEYKNIEIDNSIFGIPELIIDEELNAFNFIPGRTIMLIKE